MKKQQQAFWMTAFLLPASFVFATVVAEESAVYQMERERLLNPKQNTLQSEKEQQKVHIYEGMKLTDVEQAMDEQFGRIDNMMFILTRLPPTAAGGEERVEKDGCD